MDPNTALTLTDEVSDQMVRKKSPARSSAAQSTRSFSQCAVTPITFGQH